MMRDQQHKLDQPLVLEELPGLVQLKLDFLLLMQDTVLLKLKSDPPIEIVLVSHLQVPPISKQGLVQQGGLAHCTLIITQLRSDTAFGTEFRNSHLSLYTETLVEVNQANI